MAVTTTKTNKPLNPRGNDQSPKGYNRASLFSGKALDFDGVNDYVDCGTLDVTNYTEISISLYVNIDAIADSRIVSLKHTGGDDLRIFTASGSGNKMLFALDDTTPVTIETPIETNQWFHIVMTHDGTTLKAFVNGQEAVSAASNFNYSSADGKLWLGRYTDGTLYYNGEIAGFKIFNTALTAAQVADLYNNPEKIVPTGVADSALKLWLPMMEGAGTYCINGADPLGDDEYDGAGSFDSATGWTLNTGFSIGNGSLSCNGTQTASTSAYYNISSVASSLVMVQFTLSNVTAGQVQLAFFGASGTTTKWYTADGTYTEYVEVAAGHNGNTGFIANADFVGDIDDLTLKVVNTGAISGATWTHGVGSPVAQTAVIDWNKETTGAGTTMLLPQGLTTGRDITGVNLFENVRKQGALNLDGNSWAEVHDNASFDLAELTLECWFYADSSAVSDGLLGQWSGNQGYLLYVTNSSDFRFYVNGVSRVYSTALTGWNHIAGVYDGATMKLYINGAQEVSGAHTTDPTSIDRPIEIGRVNQATSTQYTNQIAQPRIYNRALTAEEVLRNYNSEKNTYQ